MAKRTGRPPANACECGEHVWAPLSKIGVTLVSPEDAHWLQRRFWSYQDSKVDPHRVYAQSCIDYRSTLLHRAIMGEPKRQVDHKNRNSLDNRRHNLRLATGTQNAGNRRVSKNSSGYKGVTWRPDAKKWEASLNAKGGYMYLGRFEDKHNAAEAYNAAAKSYFGEYANLNNVVRV